MKKLVLPILLLGLVLAVAGVWFLGRSSTATVPSGSDAAADASASAAAAQASLASETPIDAKEVSASDIQRENLPAADEKTTETWDLAASIWVEGVVRTPSGCADEGPVEVIATSTPIEADGLARILDHERRPKTLLSRRTVGSDGRFRIPFPPDAKVGNLSVRGRFLFTSDSVSVDLSAKSPSVTLDPLCGALVLGTIAVPDPSPVTLAGLDGKETTLRSSLQNFGGGLSGTRGFRRRATLKDGAFEFRAIPTESACTLEIEPTKLAAADLEVEKPTPGREMRVRVDLLRGATIRGTVRDDSGKPVAAAEVEAARPGQFFGFDNREVRTGKSKDDGTYELEAVAPGAIVVTAKLETYLDSERANVQLKDGGAANAVDLVLTQGNRVSGSVAWADGKPAAAVDVDLRFDRSQLFGMGAFNAARGASGKAKTDAQGGFSITGLGKGPFTLEAEAPPPDAGAAADPKDDGPELEDSGLTNKVSGKKKVWWRARADGVQPGASGVALVLRAPEGIPGHVVDEKGEPITKFKIQAVRQGKGMMGSFGEEERDESFEDKKGAFLMTGLMEGNWNLYAVAEGFGLPEPVSIEIPRKPGAEEIAIALEHAASVAGIVKSPNGSFVAGATVSVDTGEPSWKATIQSGPKPAKSTSNADGTFVLDGLHSGKIRVAAGAKDWAKSAPAELDLVPGQRATGVELILREGGLLTGEVFGEGGRPSVGMFVQAVQMKDFDSKMSFTGSKGEFRIEHLLPGSWQVIAMPARGNESITAPDEKNKEVSDAAAALFQKMKMTVATINEGEETHVVLGAPPKDPVDVHGTVTHSGEPLGGSMVIFVAEGKDSLKSMKTCKVEKDGTYAVRVDAAGHYAVSVQQGFGGMGQQSTVEFSEDIPEVKEHKLDLQMPTARVSGMVRGPDGEPAVGARVSLHPESAVATGTMWGGQYHEGATDADGRFDVQFLRAGTYSLAVGGSAFGGLMGGDDAMFGREVRGGLKLSDGEWMRDADFRLKKPGMLNVTVVDAGGQPVPEASVFARDAGGRLVDALSMSSTDASGKAKYRGLGPGTYTIVARKDLLTSTDSAHVKLDEGGSGEVQVALQPGTIVIVTCVGGEESKPIRASLSVQDESGREVGAMISIGEAMKLFSENGFSTMERRVGPLPQGKYTVRATGPDGKVVTKQVDLRGQAERKLTIHLD